MRFGRFIELEQSDKELAAFEGDTLLAILEKRDNLYKPRKVLSNLTGVWDGILPLDISKSDYNFAKNVIE